MWMSFSPGGTILSITNNKKYAARFKIQEVFIVNLYRSIHKVFDMLFSTNTTKVG